MNTTPAQRANLYEDLEQLIDPGFLSRSITIGGSVYWFRTFGEADRLLLRARSRSGDSVCWTLATSLWMVDGRVLLGDSEALHVAYDHFSSLPSHVLAQLYSVVLGLFNRGRKAEYGILSFCYEPYSRMLWRSSSCGTRLTRPVPGVETAGQSRARQTWICFNQMEDQREQTDSAWDQFMLVASVQNPKATEKVRNSMVTLDHQIRDMRQQEQDRYYMLRNGFISYEQWSKAGEKKTSGIGPKTVERLQHEMDLWLSGEKDEHDLIVEEFRQSVLRRKDEVEAARKAAAAEWAEEAARREQEALDNGLDNQPMVGYTPEQLDRILADQVRHRVVYDDSSDQAQHFERFAQSDRLKMGPR